MSQTVNATEEKDPKIASLKKSIAENPDNANTYYSLGLALAALHRFTEAVEAYDESIKRQPSHSESHRTKANSLFALRRLEEALEAYNKAIELNPGRLNTYAMRGMTMEELGKHEEAMQQYDHVISKESTHFLGNMYKADLLYTLGKKDEALSYYEKAGKGRNNAPHVVVRMAAIYTERGEKDKAMELYRTVDKMQTVDPLDLVERGRCYSALGRDKEALADFKKAREDLPKTQVFLSAAYLKFIDETLKLVLDTQEVATKSEDLVKNLDAQNPAVQKFLKGFKVLIENKDKAQQTIINKFDNTNAAAEYKKEVETLESIKEQMKAQYTALQKELSQVKNELGEVKEKVTKLENELQNIKEELDNKLDDFKKKLAKDLAKQDLSSEDIASLTEYFNAFLETFSSIYVTSQVVNSGQVKLDSDNNATSILSFLASFTPFLGDALSKGISSVGEFLQSVEMKRNARKILGLASDNSELSQTLGKTAYEIALQTEKQRKICATTSEDMAASSGTLITKLRQLVNKVSEDIDIYLYSNLYKTPAARAGHQDANELIEKWVKEEFMPYDVSKQFVKHILEKSNSKEGASSNPSSPQKTCESGVNRSSCCNLF